MFNPTKCISRIRPRVKKRGEKEFAEKGVFRELKNAGICLTSLQQMYIYGTSYEFDDQRRTDCLRVDIVYRDAPLNEVGTFIMCIHKYLQVKFSLYIF